MDTKITQDLFKIIECNDCNGTGKIEHPTENREDDCDTCSGKGVID